MPARRNAESFTIRNKSRKNVLWHKSFFLEFAVLLYGMDLDSERWKEVTVRQVEGKK